MSSCSHAKLCVWRLFAEPNRVRTGVPRLFSMFSKPPGRCCWGTYTGFTLSAPHCLSVTLPALKPDKMFHSHFAVPVANPTQCMCSAKACWVNESSHVSISHGQSSPPSSVPLQTLPILTVHFKSHLFLQSSQETYCVLFD